MVYSNMGTILILINLLTLFLLLKHYLERIKQVCSSSKGGRKKRMSTWDSSRKPFWCTYRFPWQPNNQCLGTLRLGHIYCWPGDGGVQRSENCWKRGSGLNKQDIDINDKIYNTLSLKFKVNQDGHPKDAKKEVYMMMTFH